MLRTIKRFSRKSKRVESGFRVIKSILDLISSRDVKICNIQYPISTESFVRRMKGGFTENRKVLTSYRVKINKVNHQHIEESLRLIDVIKSLQVKCDIITEDQVSSIVVLGRRYFRNTITGATKDLLSLARSENPGKLIHYYPSVNERINNKNLLKTLPSDVIVSDDFDLLHETMSRCDKAYVFNNLWGYDAFLYGLDVHVFGAPFYAYIEGVNYRGTRKLNKTSHGEIFYNVFLKDNTYRSSLAKEFVSFSLILSLLHLQREKSYSFYTKKIESSQFHRLDKSVDSVTPLYQPSVKYLLELSPDKATFSYKIIDKWVKCEPPTSNEVREYIEAHPRKVVSYYLGWEELFRSCVEFDLMKKFVDDFVLVINQLQIVGLISQKNRFKLYDELVRTYKAGRGRQFHNNVNIPEVDYNLDVRTNSDKRKCITLLQLLSVTFRYDELNEHLRGCTVYDSESWLSFALAYKKTASFDAMRVERSWKIRRELQSYLAQKYIGCNLNRKSKNWLDFIYYTIIDDLDMLNVSVKKAVESKETLDELNNSEIRLIVDFLCQVKLGELSRKFIDNNIWYLDNDFVTAIEVSNDINDYQLDSINVVHCNSFLFNTVQSKLKSTGDFSKAKKNIELRLKHAVFLTNTTEISKYEKQYTLINFLETAKDIASINIPTKPEGLVFLCHGLGHIPATALSATLIPEFSKKGYQCVSLSLEANITPMSGVTSFDKYIGSLGFNCSDGNIVLDWTIDWGEKIVECAGVNYYQGIYEHLSIRFRRFDIDIDEPGIDSLFLLTLKQCDRALRLCHQIESDPDLKDLPIVFLGTSSHRAPGSIFRDFALRKENRNISYSNYNIGYDKYYKGQSTRFSRTITVFDMTAQPERRAGFLADTIKFDQWITDAENIRLANDKVQHLINMQRGANSLEVNYESFNRINIARKQGKKIICCFGKLLFDLAVPYDGGPAHKDMVDWIRHTVECLSRCEDILLLIKPHPVELVAESALDIQQYFRDVLPKVLPENTVFLGHDEFNTSELAPLLDLAILYNGTSSLELTTLGVPVMMTSYFGKHDYPVELLYPESRTQYEDFLLGLDYSEPKGEIRQRAAGLLYYMGTDDVSLKNDYCMRPSTNDYTGTPIWDKKAILKYKVSGDCFLEVAVDRALENSEKYRSKYNRKKNA